MALQTDNLVMAGLGVLGDVPPNALQPPLVDGIHLRWSFRLDLGFPWYGFYLFRRRHQESRPMCLGQVLANIPAGPWPSAQLNTPLGEASSDQKLAFTDDFAAAGSAEFDLRGRTHLRLTLNPAHRAYRVAVRIGFRGAPGDDVSPIGIRALDDAAVAIVEATAEGKGGQVVEVVLEASSIAAVDVSGGEAAVVDICSFPVAQAVTSGWEPVPGFNGPMSLPVSHPQYPCSSGPTNESASQSLALSRIRYGPDTAWQGEPFSELHDQLLQLVQDGPGGTPMALRHSLVDGAATPPDPEVGPPRMVEQYPLQLVLFATLHPAVAQMAGLYWVDKEVDHSQSYDYLVVADHTGAGNKSEAGVLDAIATAGFTDLDGYIVFDKRIEPAPPLDPPADVRCYALPGTTVAASDGSLTDATSNAGLRWELGTLAPGVLVPGAALMYHVWRDKQGDASVPMPSGEYTRITADPALVADPVLPPGAQPARPLDWPPFPLHFVDTALPEGWYSYRVSGIDIFGRHSPASADARWFQWAPAPAPRPWYYEEPPAEKVVHPSAVRLLDKVGPPPPHAVEAVALDPADPTLLKDTLYTGWFNTLSAAEQQTLVGLRVRWEWTDAHMRQAPDTREFRIYLQPDALNARPGRITSVTAVTQGESDIVTSIPNTHGADAYVGAWLRVGTSAFPVVGSGGATPLALRVRNIGAAGDVRPPADASCTLSIPQVYNTGSVTVTRGSTLVKGAGTRWTPGLVGTTFKVAGELGTYIVAAVIAPNELVLERDYEGTDATATPYGMRFPLYVDFSRGASWQERLYVVPFDEHVALTTDEAGRPLRKYELIVPAAGDAVRTGLQLATSLTEPVRHAHVGVSAADIRTHTLDDPKWTAGHWGGADRFGNEGPVAAPARIFVVRRIPPPPPPVPVDSERVYASPADYHSHSFYTYRWIPSPHLKTHIFRALDDAVFRADWQRRATDTSNLDPNQLERFPADWSAARRQQVAAELNHLNTFAHDAGKPAAMAYYRSLSNDGLRILAALPGHERAFTQVTIQPLDPNDPATANRRGPDNPADHPIDPGLRVWIDTLDGRSANRYFYRAAYVDAAHNRGPLGLSSPPVWLPDVVPPRTPVITRISGGDRAITIRWAPNREPDLAEYRVYRAASEAAARDLRLMTLVHTVLVPPDIFSPPGDVVFTDTAVAGLVTYHYRVAAADTSGNVSVPSAPVAGRAFDDARPAPPAWDAPAVDETTGAVTLHWSSPVDNLTCLVQRSLPGAGAWTSVSGWLARGTYTFADVARVPGDTYDYRLRVMDARGRLNSSFTIETV